MATIDSNIAMGYKPIQIENPLNQLAAYSQIQGAQQNQQLNMLKIREAEQSMENRSNIRNIPGSINDPDYISKVAKYDPELAVKLQKDLAAFKTSGLQTTKLESEIVDSKLKQSRQFLDTIDPADPSAPARYLSWHEANHRDPVLGPMLAARGVTVDQSRANIDNAIRQGPQAFATLLNQSKIGVEKFAELNKPQVFQENLGGVNRVSTIPGMGGAPTIVSNTRKEATPGELLVDKRARERLTLDQDKATRDLTMGTIPAGYRLNKVTNELEAIPGGPTTVALSPKDKQKREAAYPKATSSLKAFDDTSNSLIKDLAELRDHPGLSSITGIAAGRAPGITKAGRAAQALYDKIVARGGFQALTDLKAAGGTLGAVSNQEGTQLKDSWAAINRTQDADDVRKALDQALATVQTSKDRIRDEYESTYEYRNTVPRSSVAPNQTKSGGVDTNNPLLK
jgi:hypothetical protein